jgi:glycosyltransferase involved in cell wall biosynthesis
LPARMGAERLLGGTATIHELPYAPLTLPRSPVELARMSVGFGRDVRALGAHFRRVRPHLVLAVSSFVPAVLLAARSSGARCVVYAAELFEKGYERRAVRSFGARALVRYTGLFADGIVACSSGVATQYRTCGAPVATVYPGIAAPDEVRTRAAARAALGVPETAFCVAVVGNVTAGRGQDVLLQALPVIRETVPELVCLVAGEPHPRPVDRAYREWLARLAGTLGVERQVRFLGYVDRVTDVYTAADVVVNPARLNEAFGRAPLEALSLGTPVVSTRVGAVPEVLRDRRDALLVPPDDPGALARAVLELAAEPDTAAALVTRGREHVFHRFDEAAQTERFLAATLSVL